MKKIALLVSFALVASGCASVQSISLTPVPVNRQKVVRASVEKFVILAFNFDNDYVDGLADDLKRQCPNGVVSGILTKDEVISYILAHKRIVTATGFCSSNLAQNETSKRKTASPDSGVQ